MKSSFESRRRTGVALVLVMAFLTLITVLIVSFFSSVMTEVSESKSYANEATTKQLTDSAVQMVMGTIKLATTGGSSIAWASQPGMIRTYDSSGNPVAYYKLYSSNQMILTGAAQASAFSPADDLKIGSGNQLTDWAAQPAVFTDLNAPVTTSSGTNYPILDPNAQGSVDGFDLSAGTDSPVGSIQNTNSAPMPVKWIYVLRDGTLTTPASVDSTGKIASWTGTDGAPSATNPITGRIAFWTDDETCKVNINTASEGTYWDTPRANTNQEQDLADKQPVQKEFQRYPGHPAMTSLSAVFTSLKPDQIYNIVPRVAGGGSLAGSVSTTPSTAILKTDSDRLYASIDELAFNADRGANPGISTDQLQRAKFFLTASSRAPEVNLYNKPRIACWPLYQDLAAGYVTAYDKLIARCSTINGKPYYFQRKINTNGTNDIGITRNGQLYSYLQNLTHTAVPGFGGNFFSKYGSDRDQILTEIFDYIRSTNLADDTVDHTFTPTYIGTPSYGWVVPTQTVPPLTTGTTLGMGRIYSLSSLSIGFICNADFNVPASNGTASNAVLGSNALTTAGQKYIQSIMVPDFFSAMQGWVGMCPDMQIGISGLQNLTVTVNGVTQKLFPNSKDTDRAYYGIWPGGYYGGRAWGGAPIWRYFGFSKWAPDQGNMNTYVGTNHNQVGIYPFVGQPIMINDAAATGYTAGTMIFNGGDITVSFYAGSTPTASVLIQTLKLHLPGGTFPTPAIVTALTNGAAKENWWAFSQGQVSPAIPGRLQNIGNDEAGSGAFFLKDFDVVQSILPRHGDFRLISASPYLDDTASGPNGANHVFVPHPRYAANRIAHTLTGMGSESSGKDLSGKYISALSYPPDQAPTIPSGATTANRPEATGDYDTGTALVPDGSFANKPDEGNTFRSATSPIPYYISDNGLTTSGTTFFTPNRLMPSAGVFGSLPTGVIADVPWKTLLFRPQGADFPASGATGLLRHPAYSTTIPDHLFLDLFWMPVVEPYAISDPFATAGKINMNYQIMPFTYIERSTGLWAVLKSEKVGSIPNTRVNTYKSTLTSGTFRLDVNIAETLKQFKSKFSNSDIFKSASEICDLHIVPRDPDSPSLTAATMPDYWNAHQLTGDNLRERIYTTIYPRLTTKSNTYTVHYKVQVLKKSSSSPASNWNETKDKVIGEYRGSSTIERYINPNDATIPDFTDAATTSDLGSSYKWHVIGTRQFTP